MLRKRGNRIRGWLGEVDLPVPKRVVVNKVLVILGCIVCKWNIGT
jgi:hypothetical protein